MYNSTQAPPTDRDTMYIPPEIRTQPLANPIVVEVNYKEHEPVVSAVIRLLHAACQLLDDGTYEGDILRIDDARTDIERLAHRLSEEIDPR